MLLKTFNFKIEHWISTAVGILVLYLFCGTDNVCLKILGLYIFIGLIIFWYRCLLQYMRATWDLIKNIRQKNFFRVTETGYRLDLKNRRVVGNRIYGGTNIGFLVMFLVLSQFLFIFGKRISTPFNVLTLLMVFIMCFGILQVIRNYATGFWYYLLPFLALVFAVDYAGHRNSVQLYDSTRVILIFLPVVVAIYVIFVLSLPLYSLRKITSKTWIFGVLFVSLVPLLLGHVFKDYIIDILQSQTFYKTIVEKISREVNTLSVKNNIFLADWLEHILKMSISDMIGSALSLASVLLVTGYSLGLMVINMKIELGKAKAKDLYNKIIFSKKVEYADLRDCIFYGGEQYEDKIMCNPIYAKLVYSEESKIEKYEETAKWRKIITEISEHLKRMIKRFI